MFNNSHDIIYPPQEIRILHLLQELEKNPMITQRELSHRVGIALGITNACLKTMSQKEWVTLKFINGKRVSYFLTPKGMSEKKRLTTSFLSYRIKNYEELKFIFKNKFMELEQKGIKRIVFYGVSDEMEVAYITIQRTKMELAGIVEDDEHWRPVRLFGFELRKLDEMIDMDPDAVLITTLQDIANQRMERLEKMVGFKKKVFFQQL